MKMQTVVMNKIKSMMESKASDKVAWVEKSDWSNTGSIYFINQDDLSTVGSFTYDFQQDSFTLRFFGDGHKPQQAVGFDPVGTIGTVYGKYESLPEMVSKVDTNLNKIFN